MTIRKFSEPVEALRKIFARKSHGIRTTLYQDGIWLTYRSRYAEPIDRIAKLVREAAGGEILEQGKTGKIRQRLDGKDTTTCLTQPNYITFSIGIDEDIFLLTGERLPEIQRRGVQS